MNNMKRIMALVLAVIMLAGLVGCSGKTENNTGDNTVTEAPVDNKTTEADAPKAAETPVESGSAEGTESNTSENAAAEAPAATEAPAEATEPAAPVDMNLAVMTGPTAIGMIKVMSDAEAGTAANNYHFNVYGTADEISTGLMKGELDAACVPCNLASVLYNKSEGKIRVAAINTLGVLYIVETGEAINSIEDLRGKTIYSTGQGTTPEFTLRYLLSSAGIDPDNDVVIEYKSEAAEVAAMLTEAEDAVAMLPQPFVTATMMKNEKLRIALSVTEEWEKLNADSTVVTGVLVARAEFIDNNKAAFDKFLDEYEASAEFANSNIEDAAAALEHFDIFKAAVAKKAIPFCNVTFKAGDEMKKLVSAYLQVLFDQKAGAVGGAMPAEDFYYSR